MKKRGVSKPDDRVCEQPMTYDEYANLPDNGMRYELADGILEAMTPSPSAIHQLVIHQIADMIKHSCSHDFVVFLAPIDVILSEREVRQPDIVILHREGLSIVTKRGIEGTPDLVVEVLSPHSVKRDRQSKLKTYAKYGIVEYWIVDAGNEVLEQYVLDGKRYKLKEAYVEDEAVHSDQLPCASFTMNDIMRSLPELPNY